MTRAARLLLAVAALFAGVPSTATAAGDSTAVVVIDTGASVRAAVIHFDGSISGIDALELAGGNPTTYGFSGNGAAVCSIDGVGNPANESCLVGPHSEYWAYFLAHGGSTSWAYSRGCACTTTVHDGDVEGWRYGTGAAPRSSASFCAYVACPPPPTSPGDGGTGGTGTTPATTVPGGPPIGPGGEQSAGNPQTGDSRSAAPEAANTDGEPGSAEPTTSTTPPTTTSSGPRDRPDVQVEAASASKKGGGGGGDATGSPTGVVIAAGALAATAGAAVWLRRRRGALR
ncbi:MAG: hypothetical protein WD271_09050 [Acidimicrobiia bacterium]